MREPIPVYVGYDSRESIAYHVFCDSAIRNTSVPVSFHPIRGERRDGSNDFTYSRFTVPWLSGFNGWAIWADGDMLCQADIRELWSLIDYRSAVQVVKHDYRTKYPIKYLGNVNEDYPRKNWSSLMLINCAHFGWRQMSPEVVAKMSGADLHRFAFLKDEQIGDIPITWNWLVGEYDDNPDAKLLHYTLGIPPLCSKTTDYESRRRWWLAQGTLQL